MIVACSTVRRVPGVPGNRNTRALTIFFWLFIQNYPIQNHPGHRNIRVLSEQFWHHCAGHFILFIPPVSIGNPSLHQIIIRICFWLVKLNKNLNKLWDGNAVSPGSIGNPSHHLHQDIVPVRHTVADHKCKNHRHIWNSNICRYVKGFPPKLLPNPFFSN